ncbi:MAG: WD40 repeat domain-containing protein [Isosphaeraceae bacterium]|nr:WD40 repeat domain-containing protein [Isosphaeraceae bacterium]
MLHLLARFWGWIRSIRPTGPSTMRYRPIPIPVEATRRIAPGLRRAFYGLAVLGLASTSVFAQGRIRDFTEPQLVQNSDGHHAPIHALIFADAAGSTLLSAGADKVVHEWNLAQADLTPRRTLRPPIWRGRRGEIRAMALSPRVAANDQRILAVAGFGFAYNGGDVVLFRYPGLDLDGRKTGDLIAHLPVAEIAAPEAGHRDTILALAFSPDGARLASASLDGTVRIWDVERRATLAILGGHVGGVSAVAWPSADLIVTGDARGDLRVWRLDPAPREVARASVAAGLEPVIGVDAIKAIAVDREAKRLFVGDGVGRITRWSLPDLADAFRFPTRPTIGGVTALALDPDGTRLAAAHSVKPADPNEIDFDDRSSTVELYAVPTEGAPRTLARADDLTTALLFTPDGRTLIHAGGADQAIQFRDVAVVDGAPTRILRGHGSTIRVVAWAREGLGVAIARTLAADDAEDREGFDLTERRPARYPKEGLARAIPEYAGRRIERRGVSRVAVAGPGVPDVVIDLDPRVEGSVWSTSFIPPREAGGIPLVAIGCTAGVAIYRLEPKVERTRFLAGHEGEVLSLAPTPDGRRLASAGSDQTIRLWSLLEAERVPTLGATIRVEQNGAVVFDSIERGGFADAMGIEPLSVLESALVDGRSVAPVDFLAAADAATPSPATNLQVSVILPGDGAPDARRLRVMTSKRSSPLASLFLADRPAGEWVLWTPAGFYDSSIGGDGKYLGWHLNQSTRLDLPRPTLFYPIARFQDRLRQPELIGTLLASGDERVMMREVIQRALAEPAVIVQSSRPPRLGVDLGAVVAGLGRIRVKATALSGAAVRELRVLNGTKLEPARPIAGNANAVETAVDVALAPGRNRVTIEAVDDAGRVETDWVDVDVPATRGIGRPARATILALGVDRIGGGSIDVPHAERDAVEFAAWLADRAVSPTTGERFSAGQVETRVLVGSEATSAALLRELDSIAAKASMDAIAGDLVVISLTPQFLVDSGRLDLAAADLATLAPPSPSAAGSEVADRLGRISRAGAAVVVLLDGVHRDASALEGRTVSDWIRRLRDREGVTVFLASDARRPSEPRLVDGRVTFPTIRRRLHVQAMIDLGRAGVARRVRADERGRFSIDAVHLSTNEAVREATRGRQLTGAYVPDTVPPNRPLFDLSPR